MEAAAFAVEPMLIRESDATLEDLTFDLVQSASSLAAALKPEVRREIGRLVRSVNCYHSNLLEGHQTHPRDIERALASDYSTDPAKRSLQAEARAHIDVRTAIDLDVDAPKDWPASEAYVRWVHHEFCRRLPEDMLVTRTVDTKRLVRILPGEFRTDTVEVGQHTPPPAELLPVFMARFTEAYCADRPRNTDLDGRGPLSLEALKEFCRFFLGVCIDQIAFMHSLLKPGEILRRIELYVNDEIAAKRLPTGSFEMLREAFYEGSVPRGRAPQITGYEERRARDTLSALLERGLLIASSPRGPVSLGIPMDVVERWLPTLYPVDAPVVPTSSR